MMFRTSDSSKTAPHVRSVDNEGVVGDAQDGRDGVDGEDEVGELDANQTQQEGRGLLRSVHLIGQVKDVGGGGCLLYTSDAADE